MIKNIAILILIFASSCSDGIPRLEEPKNLVPRDKMIEVLKEMTKLEAHIQIHYVSVDKYNKVMINSGDSLLNSYGLTKDVFEESMEYYGSRQKVMQGIYSEVLDELNEELGELQSQ